MCVKDRERERERESFVNDKWYGIVSCGHNH